MSACIQFNAQRAEIRAALKDSLVTLVPDPAAISENQRAQLDRYSTSVDAKLPFRDCTPSGLEQYFKNPPADPALTPTTTR